jgi:hypothetical protein
VNVDTGIALEELFYVRRQHVQANTVDGRDPDASGHDVLDFLELALEGLVHLQNLFAMLIKHAAFRSQAEILFAALNQERFELPFERADGLADRRLRHAVYLSRFGEAFRLGQIAENLQTFDLHGSSE